jgi:uncharacterized membrane protein YgdD (TMEM256/DUF423 family)
VQLGALLAFLGVGLGAFGAHLLADALPEHRLATFETAVRYQMYHALGLVAVGALPRVVHRPAWLLFAGSLVFSGSLYLLVLANLPWMGAVAPVGGVLQLAGWAWLFLRARHLFDRNERITL